MIITKARQSGKKCNGFKGCGDNIYIGFEYCKLRGRKCLCKACADKFKIKGNIMKKMQDEIDDVSELPAYYDKYTDDIKVVPTHVAEKWIKQSIHSEIHKLANIMGREFGEREESFLRQYATKVNNDFNNK